MVAVVAAWGVWALWRFFVGTYEGQLADQLALDGARTGRRTLWTVAEPVLDVVSVAFVAGGIATAVLVAVVRRRWVLAIQVGTLVVGANLTTQVVKRFLGRSDLIDKGGYLDNTLPSGHTTAAASVAAAVLLVVPRRWRPLVAVLGGTYTAATGWSTYVGQWHRPSDVIAAVLVVLAWAAIVCAFSSGSALDHPRRAGDSLATPGSAAAAALMILAGLVAGAVAVGALAAVMGYDWGLLTGGDLTAYAGGVLGTVAASALAFAVLLLLRQATARPVSPSTSPRQSPRRTS